jgi:hypothetical protein
MQTPNLDKLLQDAGSGASLFTLEKEVPPALKEMSAWKADMESRVAALEVRTATPVAGKADTGAAK